METFGFFEGIVKNNNPEFRFNVTTVYDQKRQSGSQRVCSQVGRSCQNPRKGYSQQGRDTSCQGFLFSPPTGALCSSQHPLNSFGVAMIQFKRRCRLLTRSTACHAPGQGHISHGGSREGMPQGNGRFMGCDPNLSGLSTAT